jgi:hypothetical protein
MPPISDVSSGVDGLPDSDVPGPPTSQPDGLATQDDPAMQLDAPETFQSKKKRKCPTNQVHKSVAPLSVLP